MEITIPTSSSDTQPPRAPPEFNALEFWTLYGQKSPSQVKSSYLVNVGEHPGFGPAIVSTAHLAPCHRNTTRQGADYWHPNVGANEKGINAPWQEPQAESWIEWSDLCGRNSCVYRMGALHDDPDDEERASLIFGLVNLKGGWRSDVERHFQRFIPLPLMLYPDHPNFYKPAALAAPITTTDLKQLRLTSEALFLPSLTNPELQSSFRRDDHEERLMKALPLPIIAGMKETIVRKTAYTSVYTMMRAFGVTQPALDVDREVSFLVNIVKATRSATDVPKLVVPRADCAVRFRKIPVAWLEEDPDGRTWEDFHLAALFMWKLAVVFQLTAKREFLFVAIWVNKWNHETLPWDSCLQTFHITDQGQLLQSRHDYGSKPIEYSQMLIDLHFLLEKQLLLAEKIPNIVWTSFEEKLKEMDGELKTTFATRFPVSTKSATHSHSRGGDDDDHEEGGNPDNKRRRTGSNKGRHRQSANDTPQADEGGRRISGGTKHNLIGSSLADLSLHLDALERRRQLGLNEVFFLRTRPESEPLLVAKVASPLEIEITTRLQAVPQGVVRMLPPPEVSFGIEGCSRSGLLVMSYEGCTLTQYLARRADPGTFLPSPLDITRALVFGLLQVHELNVAHCDIKPDNVCVSAHPGREATLIDFGLSHTLDGHRDGTFDHINLPKAFGTDGWMAPEVIARESTSLIAADLWSLGATLAHMCKSLVQLSIAEEKTIQCILDAAKGLMRNNPSERSNLRSV